MHNNSSMYMIGAWKLLSLQNCVKNVQYPTILPKSYSLSKGEPSLELQSTLPIPCVWQYVVAAFVTCKRV
jgi:hypothetical protein